MDEEKEELIEQLVRLLRDYRKRLAFHCDKKSLDREIGQLINKIKNL